MPTPTPTISPYALTTLERVRTRLTFDVANTQFDSYLIRLINSVTSHIEGQLGLDQSHHIVQATYTNEVYSMRHNKQIYLILRMAPVTVLTKFQWRAGTPSDPNWTDFIINQYELINPSNAPDGSMWYTTGIIRIYGVLPRIYDNMVRATYTAGFPVDWANEGTSTHWLPADISQLADDLVVRFFKRRELAGQSSQSLEGQSIAGWRNLMDQDDIDIIGRHARRQFF